MLSRRNFFLMSIAGGVVNFFTGEAYAKKPTPQEIEGPFYPLYVQKDKDFDLTKIDGKTGEARGEVIFIEGQVVDTQGNSIENATVDLWQANAAGRYRHPHDSSKVPLDPNFQGWAVILSGKDGKFCFKTIFPGTYPASSSWVRPPHIHFKVSKLGFIEIITQMYFPEQPLNNTDLLLTQKKEENRSLMIAKQIKYTPKTFLYDIVLQKA